MLNPDFREMLSALTEEDAEFLVIGAYALAVHGLPRATGDLDLWVRRSRENAERVLRALEVFGAPTTDLSLDDLVTPDLVFQIGREPRRIDFLTSIDGVEFEEAWERRVALELDGVPVLVLGREDLIRNKRAVGRARDLADIEALEEGGDPR